MSGQRITGRRRPRRPRRARARAARRRRGARRPAPSRTVPDAAAGARLVADVAPRSTCCSTPRSPAATSTTPPAGCAPRAAASTRSARPATRPTPSSPPPCGRPTRRCCTTARAASTSPGPSRSPGTTASATSCSGLLAAADEPIAGGRHKVFGHADLAVIPQTSTIASHLPRALGVAFAIGRGRRARTCDTQWPADALAVCSFGDASLNHSTAQGAINAAAYTAHQGVPLPLLFVCEDNGLGDQRADPGRLGRRVAVEPARACVRVRRRHRSGRRVRRRRGARRAGARRAAPGVLHLRIVRFGGHAGTDVESAYRDAGGIRADRDADPMVATARLLVAGGVATPAELVRARSSTRRAVVRARAAELIGLPAAEQRRRGDRAAGPSAAAAGRRPGRRRRAAPHAGARFFGTLPEDGPPLTLAESINRTLGDLLAADPSVLVFGEDVGAKGGVYGVTRGLQRMAGGDRVFDTLLDEQTILGLALGAGVSGMLPIPEIQYLAYLHNADGPAARRGGDAVVLLQRASTSTRWSCASPATATRRGSAGTSTTTTPSAGCATSPASSSPRRRAGPTPRRCCARAPRRRRPTARCACSSSRSPCTTPATCTHAGDDGWLSPYVGPSGGPRPTCRSAAARVARDGDRRAHRHVGATGCTCRCASPSGCASRASAAGCSTCAGSCRCRSTSSLANARDVGRVVVVDETRHQGGVGEAVVAGARRGRLRRPDRARRRRGTRSSRSATRRTSCSSPRTTSPTPCVRSAAVNAIDAAAGPLGASSRRLPSGTASVARASVGRAGRRLRTAT